MRIKKFPSCTIVYIKSKLKYNVKYLVTFFYFIFIYNHLYLLYLSSKITKTLMHCISNYWEVERAKYQKQKNNFYERHSLWVFVSLKNLKEEISLISYLRTSSFRCIINLDTLHKAETFVSIPYIESLCIVDILKNHEK